MILLLTAFAEAHRYILQSSRTRFDSSRLQIHILRASKVVLDKTYVLRWCFFSLNWAGKGAYLFHAWCFDAGVSWFWIKRRCLFGKCDLDLHCFPPFIRTTCQSHTLLTQICPPSEPGPSLDFEGYSCLLQLGIYAVTNMPGVRLRKFASAVPSVQSCCLTRPCKQNVCMHENELASFHAFL